MTEWSRRELSGPVAVETHPTTIRSQNKNKTSVKFTLEDKSGALQDALQFFAKYKLNLTRVESRPSKRNTDYEFYVDFVGSTADSNVQNLLTELRTTCRQVSVLQSRRVPWFPRKIRDMDFVASQILDAGLDLQSDHPGFNDPVYRARRAELASIADNYKHGERIPRIKYTQDEINTWGAIWDQLMPLLDKHACDEHRRMLPLLIENCGYRRDNIPQLEEISEFLKECTGFTLRPVTGLLSARNFLYGLAFRVFFSTQYLRHHAKPLYTPEPDLVHELLGHVPLFADQAFADFSQEVGLAAIGATDEQIEQLSRCYWFSAEFGLCMQNGERRAYGAGLLSSFGELQYAMTDKPEVREWDPFKASQQSYPITEYQPVYYQATSFEDAKAKLQEFTTTFARPFNVRYNPYTQSLEVDSNVDLEAPPIIPPPKSQKLASM